MAQIDARYMIGAAASAVDSSDSQDAPRNLGDAAERVAAEPVVPALSPIVLGGAIRMIELGLIALIGTLVYAYYVQPLDGTEWRYFSVIAGVTIFAMLAFQVADIYQVQAFRGYGQPYFWLVSVWSGVFLILLGVLFFAKISEQFSRVWIFSFYLIGLMALLIFRRGLFMLVRRWTKEGRLTRRTAIVGGGQAGDALVSALRDQGDSEIHVIGVFDDRGDERSPNDMNGTRKLGTVDDLLELARRTRIDLVIFSLPIAAEVRIFQMLKKLWVLPIDIRLSAHSNKLRFRPRCYSYLGNVPVLDVFDRPITDWDVVIKWLFDKIVGAIALVLTAPLMLIIAIAIKLDSRGPVLFKQRRHGFNNELIEVYKFRSLRADMTDHAAQKSVTKDDPRVTRIGRFIRKSSIDELPQLINVVFKGNLSLVGPRPHAVNQKIENRQFDEAVDGYFARHRVKPGITGWAQINGWRGELTSPDTIKHRVEHDLYYIENWSLLFDFYILLRTPMALLKSENAY